MFVAVECAGEANQLARHAVASFPACTVVGCVAPSLTPKPGQPRVTMSVTAAVLPGIERRIVCIEDMTQSRSLADLERVGSGVASGWFLFSDPRTVDTEAVLRFMDARLGGASVMGCLVTDIQRPAATVLISGGQIYERGAVALGLGPGLTMETKVLSGCRPIGEPLIVMDAEDNLIRAFDQGEASQVVKRMVEGLSPQDRARLSTSLCLGLQLANDSKVTGTPGFVMRSLLSIDGKGVAVVSSVRPLQVVQFHLRDDQHFADSFNEFVTASGGALASADGLLHFTSSGLVSPVWEDVLTKFQVGGCFCNGEIAPLEGHSRLHGLTSTWALLRAA